jgi:type IV pilus assembly protein PilM
MSKIVKIIEDSRGEGEKDKPLLEKIIRILPEKKGAFKEVQKRGATPTQILDKIIEDNKRGEKDVVKIIEDSRGEGEKDAAVLEKIIKILPEKKSAFKEVQKRGATPTQILNKIIEDNRKVEKEKKKIEIKKEVESKEKKKEIKTIKEEPVKEVKDEKVVKSSQRIKRALAGVKGSHFFSEFFAITRYLLVGIDISDHSIEILLLDKDGSVASYGRIILEDGIIYNGEILDSKKLTESLKKALGSTKPHPLEIPEHTRKKKVSFRKKNHKAIISLPESKTYTYLFEFPDKENIYKKIEEKIKNTIPFDYEDLYWDFREIPSTKRGVKVICVAAQRDTVDSYIYFLKSANVDPVAFDIEGSSIGRALLPVKTVYEDRRKKKYKEVMADGKSRMIIDLGARTTTISVFNENAILAFSVPLPYAGNYFTKKIADKLNIKEDEADEIKQKEGFDPNGKTYEILKPYGKKIAEEVRDACNYYRREFEGEVKEILLAGGTALLPKIVEFFDEEISEISVVLGNPLRRINDLGMFGRKEVILYANVVGLARRALLNDPIKDAINLLPEEIKNQEKRSQVEKHRSVLLVALFIAISGLIFLALAAYYLIYLPVPAPIQPLKQRVLTHLDGDSGVEIIDVAVVKTELEEPAYVRRGPGSEQEIIGEAVAGERYQATTQLAGWVRIVFGEREGWIHGSSLEKIESVSLIEEKERQETEEETKEELEEVEETEETEEETIE